MVVSSGRCFEPWAQSSRSELCPKLPHLSYAPGTQGEKDTSQILGGDGSQRPTSHRRRCQRPRVTLQCMHTCTHAVSPTAQDWSSARPSQPELPNAWGLVSLTLTCTRTNVSREVEASYFGSGCSSITSRTMTGETSPDVTISSHGRCIHQPTSH